MPDRDENPYAAPEIDINDAERYVEVDPEKLTHAERVRFENSPHEETAKGCAGCCFIVLFAVGCVVVLPLGYMFLDFGLGFGPTSGPMSLVVTFGLPIFLVVGVRIAMAPLKDAYVSFHAWTWWVSLLVWLGVIGLFLLGLIYAAAASEPGAVLVAVLLVLALLGLWMLVRWPSRYLYTAEYRELLKQTPYMVYRKGKVMFDRRHPMYAKEDALAWEETDSEG